MRLLTAVAFPRTQKLCCAHYNAQPYVLKLRGGSSHFSLLQVSTSFSTFPILTHNDFTFTVSASSLRP